MGWMRRAQVTEAGGSIMADAGFSGADAFSAVMDHIPAAFAMTRGTAHTLVYSNAAFRTLTDSTSSALGTPIVEVLAGRDARVLAALLDGAFHTGTVTRDRRVAAANESARPWICSVWPEPGVGSDSECLIIELRVATEADLTLALQRDVAERMLLSVLKERDVADVAEQSRHRAAFLAVESRRLTASLDETATLDAISRTALPYLGAWCIVDLREPDGSMRRLAIIHPDPAKQALLRTIEGRWRPEAGDPFGVPAAQRSDEPIVINRGVDDALLVAAHDPDVLRTLREVGVGPLLTVPLTIDGHMAGAITFVSGQGDRPFSREDVELAEDVAVRGAMALDSARMHGDAIALRTKAELASEAKSAFLGSMSHELRTPLNAIGGYVDLLEMELRGPLTDAQRLDLGRIRSNQLHLLAMINDILNFVRIGGAHVSYDIRDVVAREALTAAMALVEPLIHENGIACDVAGCDSAIMAQADPDRLAQILVNLLSNAIKFTSSGGRITANCDAATDSVLIHVADTGVGIPADKLAAIFEPFVQVRSGMSGRDGGAGLGLAISRGLARAMHGDLTVESTPGQGSRFTLTLPRATSAV